LDGLEQVVVRGLEGAVGAVAVIDGVLRGDAVEPQVIVEQRKVGPSVV
jgi:hypothetical protein